jgi:hypothetical protein
MKTITGHAMASSPTPIFHPPSGCHLSGKDHLHLTEHANALPTSERCSGQLREVLMSAKTDFRQELGKECDRSDDVTVVYQMRRTVGKRVPTNTTSPSNSPSPTIASLQIVRRNEMRLATDLKFDECPSEWLL